MNQVLSKRKVRAFIYKNKVKQKLAFTLVFGLILFVYGIVGTMELNTLTRTKQTEIDPFCCATLAPNTFPDLEQERIYEN